MAWTKNKSRERVREDLKSLPSVKVQDLRKLIVERALQKRLDEATSSSTASEDSLVSIPRSRAVIADTVQVYIDILNFRDVRSKPGAETDEDHSNTLSFLHLFYSAIDRLIDGSPLRRVDYHDTRVHLVILRDDDQEVGEEELSTALRLAYEVDSVIRKAANDIFGDRFVPVTRCGIDAGRCIAINNGTKNEPEPLFIGSAANKAAKLARGEQGGIALSPRAKRLLRGVADLSDKEVEFGGFADPLIKSAIADSGRREFVETGAVPIAESFGALSNVRVEKALNSARKYVSESYAKSAANVPAFSFFFKPPPFSDIEFSELMPSNTIRQPMLTLFADICGYTNFVDRCLEQGNPETAVRALYIIRNELRAVLEQDFDGKKLRFIGDCIEGLSYSGSSKEIDARVTVAEGIRIAAAMLSSLEVCKDELGDIEDLELSVGLEIGSTPVSRIGIRGERSVRVASSNATATAEDSQREAQPGEMILGQAARALIPDGAQDFINEENGTATLHEYSFVAAAIGLPLTESQPNAPSVITPRAHGVAPKVSSARAHLRQS